MDEQRKKELKALIKSCALQRKELLKEQRVYRRELNNG